MAPPAAREKRVRQPHDQPVDADLGAEAVP
jgi:hypothetical protein